MKIEKVLVTGGAGYIGAALCEHLLDAGYGVILYDRFLFGSKPVAHLKNRPGLVIVHGDIRDTKKIARLLKPGMAVIHLASLSNDPSCDLDPGWSVAINHEAAMRLAAAAKAAGGGRFIFASSCSVYGYGDGKVLGENSPCNPVSLYAKLKLKTETELTAMADGSFCPVYLRQATIFGLAPRMRFDLAVNQMTLHAITRGKIFVLGGGQQWRPFLHVRDAAAAFRLALEAKREKVFCQAFNVGSNANNIKIADLARTVSGEVEAEVEVAPADADRRNYNVDFSKIARVLGFKASHSIVDGIREVAAWVGRDIKKDYNTGEFFNILRMKESASILAGGRRRAAAPRPGAQKVFDFIRAGEAFDLLLRACGVGRGDAVIAGKKSGRWLLDRLKKYGLRVTLLPAENGGMSHAALEKYLTKGTCAVFLTGAESPATLKLAKKTHAIIVTETPVAANADAVFWMRDVLPGAALSPAARIRVNGGPVGKNLRACIKKRTGEWMESPLAGKAVTDAFDLLGK
ncbi:MAG: NAD(P)-dependent oxidoreductase [Nitrospinae bacterium]|nr:NAD(P)-dependent oxidoreductase [Nitrospinota bacterium]